MNKRAKVQRKGGVERGEDSASREGKVAARVFEIDPRSLAVFRVLIGVLLLADLWIRAGDLEAMYGDGGMFPRADISRAVSSVWNWSFHFGSGAAGYEGMLFGLAAALAVALAVGFETRLAAIGSWLMLVSIQHRVPTVLSGADILMRMLLFWGMFLPLGRVASVDRWRARRRGTPAAGAEEPVRSMATVAILGQMAMMYLFSAMFKSNAEWFRGEVIKHSLEHAFYAKPLGQWLLGFPAGLKAMTWGVFGLEWIGPALLFWPKHTAWTRLAGVGLLGAMHVGIALTMNVDLFSPVSLAGLCLFLPREFWEWAARFARRGIEAAQAARPPGARERTGLGPLEMGAQGLCLLALVYVVMVNLATLSRGVPPEGGFLRTACGLGQKWNMFDEAPSRSGWYVALARLRDGTEVDLLRDGAPVSWERPADPTGMYRNFRWRKLFREMAYNDDIGYQFFRAPVSEYLCREWNARNGEEKQVAEFELIYCLDPAGSEGSNGGRTPAATRQQLFQMEGTDS